MMPNNAQGPVQPPTTRRPTLDARQTAFLRRLRKNLYPASDFQFAWDPKNNPEQRRLRRAAIIAGGVGLGAAALGVLGHRRGWFKPVPFTRQPSLPFTPPATPAPKAVAPVSPPASAATVGFPQVIPHTVPVPASVPSGNPPRKNAAASAELGKLVAKMKVKAGPSKPASPPAPSPAAAGKGSASGPAGGLPSSVAGHLAALHHAAQHGPNAAARRAAADTLKKLKEKRGIVHAVPVAAKKPKARIAPDPYRKPNRIIEDVGDRPGGRAPRHGSVAEETERQMAARFRALFLDRGDQARRLLWPDPPRWWKGRVPAMPPRGSVPAKRLAEDLRWAYRYRNAKGAGSGEIYGKIGTENARKGILRGGVTEIPSSPGTTWLDPARPQQLRLLLHEDARDRVEFFAERIKKVAAVAVPAAVEMLPGGTAINAAGLAGLRTAIAFRRLKRARFGEGFAGYGRAALEPGSVAGMLGQASQTGVRDSRAFLKRVVRRLPEPAQVLNKKLFEAAAVDTHSGGMMHRLLVPSPVQNLAFAGALVELEGRLDAIRFGHRPNEADVERAYPEIMDELNKGKGDAERTYGSIARRLGVQAPYARSYREVVRKGKEQGIGLIHRHAVAAISRPSVWLGSNAFFLPRGRRGLVIAGRKAAPKVLAHEAGHAKDYERLGGERGWKKAYEGFGDQILSPFSRSRYIRTRMLPEHRAWAESGVPDNDPLRAQALRTYANAGPGQLLSAVVRHRFELDREREGGEQGSVDRWLRRGAYLAAPVAAAGSVASVLALRRHANRLVPRVESGIASLEGAARAVHGAADHLVPHVENATAAIGGAARSVQAASGTVQDVAGRLPFLRTAKSTPGSLAKALVRGRSIGGKVPRTFLEKLHDAWARNCPIGQTFEMRFAAEPIPVALLRARQKADRERVRKLQLAHYRLFRMGALLPAVEFGGREQMKDIHDNTWANPAAAAMGTQQVYIHKDRDGNPVPMKVTLRHAQVGRYLWNRAAKAERPLRRGYGLVRDVKDVVAGNPRRTDSRGRPRPREWDKAWFKRGLTIAGATAVGLGGLAYMKHFPSQGPGLPGKVKVPFTKKSVPVGDALPPKVRDARLPSRDAILGQVEKIKDKVNQYTPDFFPKRREFRACLRRILLDVTGADWDVRDARGRSARVFAGGSYPRARREKYWWEKAHNQRVMAAVAAPALLAAGFTGGRLLRDRPLKSLNPFRNPFAMSPPGAGGNVVRNTPPPVRRTATP